MNKNSNKEIDLKREKEQKTIEFMILKYCKGHKHNKLPCDSCNELIQYTKIRIEKCPFMETKSYCSNCEVNCYSKEMRNRIKEVMRYSGPRMVFFNPIMSLNHLYQGIKYKLRKIKGKYKIYKEVKR